MIKLIDYGVNYYFLSYLDDVVATRNVYDAKAEITSVAFVGYMAGMVVIGFLSDAFNVRAVFGMLYIFLGPMYLFGYWYTG